MNNAATQSTDQTLRDKLAGKPYIILARQSQTTALTSSTETQDQQLRHRCDAAGGRHIETIALKNVTGSMPGRRKDIDELCQRRRDRADFEVLVVQVVDRFTRAGLRHGFALEERLIALGVKVLFVGEDMVLDGEHGDLLRAFKYSAAQSFAKDLSHRISSAHMRSLKEGRKTTTAVFPYGVDKLVSSPAGVPLYRIRDNRDGTQSKLHAETLRLIDTYGSVGGRTGRFRKEKDDRVTFVPGSEVEQAIVRDVYIWHYRDGLGGSSSRQATQRSEAISSWWQALERGADHADAQRSGLHGLHGWPRCPSRNLLRLVKRGAEEAQPPGIRVAYEGEHAHHLPHSRGGVPAKSPGDGRLFAI